MIGLYIIEEKRDQGDAHHGGEREGKERTKREYTMWGHDIITEAKKASSENK